MASFEFIEDELNDGNGQARFTVLDRKSVV